MVVFFYGIMKRMNEARNLLISLPNDNLRTRSKKVGLINDEIKELIHKMKEATLDWEDSRSNEVGVALAAIQIDKPLRVVIIRNNFEDKNNRDFTVFINPVITKYEGGIIQDYEGCLSVKDVYGYVPRYKKVKIKALDINGKEFRTTATDFLARVFQHEIDHTNGIVFVDHIKDSPDNFYNLDSKGQLEKLDASTINKLFKKLFE